MISAPSKNGRFLKTVHVHQMQIKKHSVQQHKKLNLHNQTDMILQNHVVTLSSITQQTNVASCCTNTPVQLFYCYTLYVQRIRVKITAVGLCWKTRYACLFVLHAFVLTFLAETRASPMRSTQLVVVETL